MKSRRKKSKIPGILVILILILLISIGWKYRKELANFFGEKQSSVANTTNRFSDADFKSSSKHTYSNGSNPIKSLSDCQIIVRRNMFEPLGGRRIEVLPISPTTKAVVPVRQEPPRSPPDPVNELILTGIVYMSNELLALIEDSSKGKSYYLRKGDKLKDYTIEKILNNEIVLVNGDSEITQTLGSKTYYNSSGKLLTSRPAYASSPSPVRRESSDRSDSSVAVSNANTADTSVSQPSGSSDSSSSNANLSLIEQMKARRKKELGQE